MEADKSHSADPLVSQKDTASRAWKYSLCYLLLKKKKKKTGQIAPFFETVWFCFCEKKHMLGNWNASADLSSAVFVGFCLITNGSRSLKVISLADYEEPWWTFLKSLMTLLTGTMRKLGSKQIWSDLMKSRKWKLRPPPPPSPPEVSQQQVWNTDWEVWSCKVVVSRSIERKQTHLKANAKLKTEETC